MEIFESVKSLVLDVLLGSFISVAIVLLVTYVKKEMFVNYGVKTGVIVSKFGNMKFGKAKWDKAEQIISIIVLGFSRGFIIGLHLDNEEEERINKIIDNKVATYENSNE
jgi:hypothetical protein